MNKELARGKLHRAARVYAEKFGFKVFPLIPRNKEPLTVHGYKDASKDLNQIDAWWNKYPNANVGIATGLDSGIIVIDFDQPDVIEAIASFEDEFGKLPDTPQVITGKKGSHLYFRCETIVKNFVGFRPNVDIRSNGGYVVAPPSIHPNGTEYTWDFGFRIGDIPILKLPENILKVLTEKLISGLAKPTFAWRELVTTPVGDGRRNSVLCSFAGHLFRRNIDSIIVRDLIHCWNQVRCQPPLDYDEVEKSLNSIAKLEIQRRTSGGQNGRN